MDDKFHEECGIFGVYKHADAARITYLGLYALQHRGQESAGIVSSDRHELHICKGMGHVADIFTEANLEELKGDVAIGHTRYSTAGDSSVKNAQPIQVKCSKGDLALCHNGNLVNADEIRSMLEAEGSIFWSTSDSEVILHLIARSHKPTIEEAVQEALLQVTGAYSLIILTEEKMIVVRDPRGFRPLCFGWLDGSPVVGSETCAFDLIDAEFEREVEPGEMLIFSESGVESRKMLPAAPHSFCIFEHVYFSRPDSQIFGRSVYQSRHLLGKYLAQEQPVEADIVVPVPDSGVAAALGFSRESGLQFEFGLIRNHYVGPHLYRAQTSHPALWCENQAESRRGSFARQTSGVGRRFARSRNNQPEDRQDGAGGWCHRSSYAHQLSSHDLALLLRCGHSQQAGADRRQPLR